MRGSVASLSPMELIPIEDRRAKRDGGEGRKASGKMLFKDAAQRFLDLHLNEWKNAKHRQQWQNTLSITPSLTSAIGRLRH